MTILSLPTAKGRPVFNAPFFPYSTRMDGFPIVGGMTPRQFDMKKLMWWIKRTPECIGIGRRIATDIVTNISFVGIEKNLTGRPAKNFKKNKEIKAQEFALRENLKEKLIAGILDWVFTGDAYLWMGKVDQKMVDQKLKEIFKEEIKSSKYLDEDDLDVTSIEIVPSSTVEVRHNASQILLYRQEVNGVPREFMPDEIIHAKFMNVDGSPYGFSPMQASGMVVETLGYIKDYATNYFKNGGTPDMIFKLPKEMANSPNFKLIEQTLEKYKNNQHKHGNLLFAGEVEVEKINEWSKDMEFRQLAIYLTGVLAFSFNMPADILSSILGADIKGSASGSDIEDTGYNRNISNAQEYWENLLNTQLFNLSFDVDMRFERTFRQDQIRLAQYRVQNVALAEFLFKHEYPLTDEFFHDTLQIPRKYLTEGEIKREVEEMNAVGGAFGASPKGANQKKYSEAKKAQQKPQERNSSNTGA